ncbi:MAG: NUDIX hydrolase [Anaerolineae bacterium]
MREPKAWKVIESKLIIDHPFIHVRDDLLEHPDDGRRFHYFYLESPSDAVATVPLTEDGCVILTRQYRHPIGRVIYDLPAGRPKAGESPQQAAARELQEETGYLAAKWQKLAYFNQFPGAIQVGTYLFLAQELTSGEQNLDRYEDLEVVKMPFAEAMDLVMGGQVIDGSMILGLLLVVQKGLAP